jgi:hypothetical protein
VVISGSIVYRYVDHEETYVAGDAYYGAPGHIPLLSPGTELIEFSPTEALRASMAVLAENMAAMRAAELWRHRKNTVGVHKELKGRGLIPDTRPDRVRGGQRWG